MLYQFLRFVRFTRLLLVVTLICGSGKEAAAIDYGVPVSEGKYPTVGLILVTLGENQSSLGTGTLLSKNIVLTAAHVIQDAPTPGAISFRALLGEGKLFASRVLAYRTHPGYINLRSDSLITPDEQTFMDTDMTATSASDIALLLLETPLPEGIPFYELSDKNPKAGADVKAVGFGLDEGKKSGNPRKLEGTLQFLKEHNGTLLFRTPKGSNQRTDHGDSGGPLLINEGGKEKIAAITHGFFLANKVDGLSPDEYGIYVSMANQRDWIDQTFGQMNRYKAPTGTTYYLTRNNRRTPFLAVTARQVFSLANSDTPIERLVSRIFSRGINEPIPADVAAGWQKRYNLPPGMLVPASPMQ